MKNYAAFTATGEVSEPLWSALRSAAGPSTLAELHGATRAHPNAIRARLTRWQRCGLVRVVAPGGSRYRIAPDAAHLVEPPFPGSLSEDAWRALRKFGRFATFEELLSASGASDRPLYCRLRRWVQQGFVERVAGTPSRFELAPAAPNLPQPPQVNDALQVKPQRRSAFSKMWKVMRVLKSFDVPTLMITAEVSRRACDDFLNLLVRAGYVRMNGYQFSKSGPGKFDWVRSWSTYTLLRNTGPRHPTFSRWQGKDTPRVLTDHNNGARVEIALRVPRQPREVNHVR